MASLQSTVGNDTARNQISSLIGNTYTLQTQTSSGLASKDDFAVFIKNIQNALDSITKIINAKTPTSEDDDMKVNSQIAIILTMIQKFEVVLISGNAQNISAALQQILAQLNAFVKQTTNISVLRVIIKFTETLTAIQKTLQPDHVDITSIWEMLTNIQKTFNQITINTVANTKISNIEILVQGLNVIVSSGNTNNIGAVLKQVY